MLKTEESLRKAEASIRQYFEETKKHVYNEPELYTLFATERGKWDVVHWASPTRFVQFLTDNGILKEVKLESEDYSPKRRLISNGATVYEVAMSLAKGGYFSHGTAVFLHGLNDQIPKTLYVNREQSVKPKSAGGITQDRLDLAFARSQRTSKYVFKFGSQRMVLLSGKNSNQFGVIQVQGPAGEPVKTTTVARTLVDIVVRPGYAGGVNQVMAAYRGAVGKVGGREVLRSLQELDFVYPYHQSIGFLMERAMFSEADVEPFRAMKPAFDFYLVHGMRAKAYDERWRLFYPKGL